MAPLSPLCCSLLSSRSLAAGSIPAVDREYRAHSYSDMEQSEIWLPDITPYNVQTGLMHALDPATALVYSSGEVFWSRPGSLTFLCRYSGLMMFPRETSISCPIEVGGWLRSGGFQGVYPFEKVDPETNKTVNDAAEISLTEETALYSYQQYQIDKIDVDNVG